MTDPASTLEFIGITATQRVDTATAATTAGNKGLSGMATHTEIGVPVGPPVNKEFAAELARAHEASGFDRVLIAHSSDQPFDHDGEFYKVTGAHASVRPPKDDAGNGQIPIYFGGASEDAIRVGGKHADAYAFWGEPLDGIRQRIAEVQAAAAPYARNPRFSVSLRPIVAETEEEAWVQAEAILAAAQAKVGTKGPLSRQGNSIVGKNAGSQRLVAAAEQGDVHDKRLWTALAKVTGGAGNSTSLVGTYEQVADGLLDYVDLGVTTLLIRGFDPLEDAKKYGRVIELVRAGHRQRPALAG